MKYVTALFFAAFAASAPSAFGASDVSTVKAEVNGMVCAFCAQGIEKKLKAMPQTKDVFVNLEKHMVAVEAKPGQTIEHDKVKRDIVDAGYEVVKIETVNASLQDVKAQLK